MYYQLWIIKTRDDYANEQRFISPVLRAPRAPVLPVGGTLHDDAFPLQLHMVLFKYLPWAADGPSSSEIQTPEPEGLTRTSEHGVST